MNLENILFHLKEARAELDETIKAIEKNKKYTYGEYMVAMSHLYHHLNTAWNSRNATKQEATECKDRDFKLWRKFPKEEELLLDE